MPDQETVNILRDFSVVMVISGAVILAFHRLRQPIILGYIIAGVIIGPFTPPFPLIRELGVVNILADMGIILLMYSLGLEFSFKRLRSVGRLAFVGGALQILIVFTLGYQAGALLGWDRATSIFLGAGLSISSTALIVKILQDQRRCEERSSQAVFGILVFEDFAAIAMIALLSGLGASQSVSLETMGWVFLKMLLFIGLSILLGLGLVSRLMEYVIATGKRELWVIVGLALCFGMALFSKSLGLSVAAGAFIAGALVAETGKGETLAHTMEPVRDMFAALFFVAVGMLLNPAYLLDYWPHILLLTAVLIAGKIVAGSVAAFLLGYKHRAAIQVGMRLAQIGEFSLIIIKVGQDGGVIQPFLYPIIVGVAGLSTLTTPYIITASVRAGERLDRLLSPDVRTFVRSMETALHRLNSPSQPLGSAAYLRHALRGIAINLFLLTAIMVLGRVAYENLDYISTMVPLPQPVLAVLPAGIALLMGALPLIAIIHYVRSQVSSGISSLAGQGRLGDFLNRPGVSKGLRNIATGMLLWVVVMIISLLLPQVPGAPYLPVAPVVAMVLITVYLLWDSIRLFHSRLEGLVTERLLGKGEPDGQEQS